MIKSKTYTVYKILCDCGGNITTKQNEFSLMRNEKPPCYNRPITLRNSYPTCQKCGKQYTIIFNSEEMKITVEEV